MAFDHNDALYEKESFRKHVETEFTTMLAAEVRCRLVFAQLTTEA